MGKYFLNLFIMINVLFSLNACANPDKNEVELTNTPDVKQFQEEVFNDGIGIKVVVPTAEITRVSTPCRKACEESSSDSSYVKILIDQSSSTRYNYGNELINDPYNLTRFLVSAISQLPGSEYIYTDINGFYSDEPSSIYPLKEDLQPISFASFREKSDWSQILSNQESSTEWCEDWGSILDFIGQEIGKLSDYNQKKVVFLIDGRLSETSTDIDEIEKEIYNNLLLTEKMYEVFIVVFSSKNLSSDIQTFWFHKIANLPNVTVRSADNYSFEDVGEDTDVSELIWVQDIFDFIISSDNLFGIAQYGWYEGPGVKEVAQLPGCYNSARLNFITLNRSDNRPLINIQGQPDNQIPMQDGARSYEYFHTFDEPDSLTCSTSTIELSGPDNLFGFYFEEIDELDILIDIDFMDSINNSEVIIDLELVSQDDRVLKDIQNCYRVKLYEIGSENSGELVREKDQSKHYSSNDDEDKFYTSNVDGHLHASWTWAPGEDVNNGEKKFNFEILRDSVLIAKSEFSIPTRYYADLQPDSLKSLSVIGDDEKYLLDIITLEYLFLYDLSDYEEVEIEVNRPGGEIPQDINDELEDELSQDHLCPDGVSVIVAETELIGTLNKFAYSISASVENNEKKYSLSTYRYVLEKCGFNTITFRFSSDLDHSIAMEYEITYDLENFGIDQFLGE